MTTTEEVPMPEPPRVGLLMGKEVCLLSDAIAYADARCAKLRAELVEVMNAETQARRERDALAEKVKALQSAISEHNDGLTASCDAIAKTRPQMCAHYKARGRKCHDCPRDHAIDAASEEKP